MMPNNAVPPNGMPHGGMPPNGMPQNSMPNNGMPHTMMQMPHNAMPMPHNAMSMPHHPQNHPQFGGSYVIVPPPGWQPQYGMPQMSQIPQVPMSSPYMGFPATSYIVMAPQGPSMGQPMGQSSGQQMGQQMGQPMNQQMGQQMGQQMNQPMQSPMGQQHMGQPHMMQPIPQGMPQPMMQPMPQGVMQPMQAMQPPMAQQNMGQQSMPPPAGQQPTGQQPSAAQQSPGQQQGATSTPASAAASPMNNQERPASNPRTESEPGQPPATAQRPMETMWHGQPRHVMMHPMAGPAFVPSMGFVNPSQIALAPYGHPMMSPPQGMAPMHMVGTERPISAPGGMGGAASGNRQTGNAKAGGGGGDKDGKNTNVSASINNVTFIPRRNSKDWRWMEFLEQLKGYKNEFGDCFVPRGYSPNLRLAGWVAEQR
jgi:Helicase associated domain